MCQFFSCVSDGRGKVYYFAAEMRRQIIAGETEYQDTDSHTSIAHHYGFRGQDEDMLNKYEYNPLTGRFIIDQQNTTYDAIEVEAFCRALDFSTVVPELIIKPIIHPLRDIEPAHTVGEIEITLLQTWDSVWASVWASVWDSVWASVWASVGASVRASVGDSVWDSVRASVRASVYGYVSSFFALEKWQHVDHGPGENPFQPCVDLWERGFVPSFDGTVWQLHSGPKARVVYEWTPGNERQ